MKRAAFSIAILAVMFAAPSHAACQTASPVPALATVITLDMQLNLTNLSPDLERVRLVCFIQSSAYSVPLPSIGSPDDAVRLLPGAELFVAQGKAVGTLSVQVPIAVANLAPDAVGKQANYTCMLTGYSTSLQRWDGLRDQHQNATFRVNPAPPVMTGNFVW
jgi:hypothetical protein